MPVLHCLNLSQAPLQKTALAVIAGQFQGARVTGCRSRGRSPTAEQIGPRGVQQMIVVEIARGSQRID